MARIDLLDIMRSRSLSPLEFNFEALNMPNMICYLSPYDIEAIRKVITSLKAKLDDKYKFIDDVLKPRGFKKFASGTNRVIYRHLEDPNFVAKIALDKVGLKDNPAEFQNQLLLKPFVAKTFQVSPCGTVGFAERLQPITRAAEFAEIADDVYEILTSKILGIYVVADVGTKYFMNWGVRKGFGPCLLDYPYVYELDGRKLSCNKLLQDEITRCTGVIDYDDGFNELICQSCAARYQARDLQNKSKNNLIIIEGGRPMKVSVIINGEVVYEPPMESSVIVKPSVPNNTKKSGSSSLSVSYYENGKLIGGEMLVPEKEKSDNPLKAYIKEKPKGKKIHTRFYNTKSPERDEKGRFLPKNMRSKFMGRGLEVEPEKAEDHQAPYYINGPEEDSVSREY